MSSAADNDGPSAAPSAADEYNPDYIDEGEDGNMIDPMYSSSQNFQHMWVLRRVFWVWSYFSAGWTHCLTFEKKPGNQICNCAMRHAGIHSFKVALKNGLLAILHYNTAVSYVSGGAVCLSCAHLASSYARNKTGTLSTSCTVLYYPTRQWTVTRRALSNAQEREMDRNCTTGFESIQSIHPSIQELSCPNCLASSSADFSNVVKYKNLFRQR